MLYVTSYKGTEKKGSILNYSKNGILYGKKETEYFKYHTL